MTMDFVDSALPCAFCGTTSPVVSGSYKRDSDSEDVWTSVQLTLDQQRRLAHLALWAIEARAESKFSTEYIIERIEAEASKIPGISAVIQRVKNHPYAVGAGAVLAFLLGALNVAGDLSTVYSVIAPQEVVVQYVEPSPPTTVHPDPTESFQRPVGEAPEGPPPQRK
ncbi:hypothetical protein [Pseudoclavibacter sp. VKM Ac-2888]|uniref:hypothetical protein n=1 Tax=Pseudoclavibacter sp. VKM Ac-2888 TaxID=2783830 RepID=UPI00188B409D|nr:hypothetical protein [Pseudoclavibacter sp. VKM Ac-2888]MBF4549214.1 hypothetical protein [Pseudoclavibacter sp. VKM Ac-2888]